MDALSTTWIKTTSVNGGGSKCQENTVAADTLAVVDARSVAHLIGFINLSISGNESPRASLIATGR